MATDPRPLVVLAGPIHPDGKALLDKEARVVVCEDETEAGLVKVAAEAQAILFRIRPDCTESLMAACKQLKVVGRHGVGLDTVDIPAATRLGVAVVHAPGSNSPANSMSRMSWQASVSETPASAAALRARPSSVSLKSTPVVGHPRRANSTEWRPKPHGASSTLAPDSSPVAPAIHSTSLAASVDSTDCEICGHASRKKRSLWNTRAL